MPVRLSPSNIRRFWAAVLSVVIGCSFVIAPAKLSWTRHWLLKDGQQGTAVVTKIVWTGHGVVGYQYRANQAEYTGVDSVRYYRHGPGDIFPPAVIGQHLEVYFSASHPWLSQLNPPMQSSGSSPLGSLFLLPVWMLECLLVLTAINPDHRWALGITEGRFFLHQGR